MTIHVQVKERKEGEEADIRRADDNSAENTQVDFFAQDRAETDSDPELTKAIPKPIGRPTLQATPATTKGNKGDRGPPGTPGTKGSTGNPGSTGSRGSKGDKGDPGSRGTAGATGTAGTPGTPGTPGAKGLDGTRGPQGTGFFEFHKLTHTSSMSNV